MRYEPLSTRVKQRLSSAAQSLRTANPTSFMQRMLDETFALPANHPAYARNHLQPGAAPLEPTFAGARPGTLAFSLEPLGPEAGGSDRRDAATHEMRRLVGGAFGGEALGWFDRSSEAYRGFANGGALHYGAFFGSSFDRDGLQSANVVYEAGENRMGDLPSQLTALVSPVMSALPGLRPVFTTLIANRAHGQQKMTFLLTSMLRVADLQPILTELGLGRQLPGILQLLGVTLGGRFDLPAGSTLIALGQSPEGPEFELHVMLDAIPDLPANFLQLLTLGLTERPRELTALERFMGAFTPTDGAWPGRFSILGIKATPVGRPKVSLFLRPVEFEVDARALDPQTAPLSAYA
jgi:hypothetical protein